MFRKCGLGSIVLILLASAFFTACSGKGTKENEIKGQSVYEKIHHELMALKTYRSEATVKYISNKGENEYNVLEHCKIDGAYRIEFLSPDSLAGTVTVFDGTTIAQYNPKISGKIVTSKKENQERSEILLTSFVKNYFTSEEVSVSVANMDNEPCTILEATIPGNHPYLTTEKLWMDNQTLKPVKLVIFDYNGSERIVVTFKSFDYNVDLEDTLFSVSQ